MKTKSKSTPSKQSKPAHTVKDIPPKGDPRGGMSTTPGGTGGGTGGRLMDP